MSLIPRWAPYVISIIAFVIAIALLSLQPSDLHQYSQPATVAYTVDIIEHGRWVLPQDTLGPATKPPLFNWFSVPLVSLFGESVFVFKLPSTIAGLSILLMVLFSARFFVIPKRAQTQARDKGLSHSNLIALITLAAGLIWVTTPLAIKISYFARPDMLLCAFLTAAWLLSTHLIRNPLCSRRVLKQFMLWLCVGGAALSKGPAAILVIAYIFIYSKYLNGSSSCAKSTGWRWGIVLSLGLFFIWLAGAYVESPKHVKTQLIGYEFVNRIAGADFIFPQISVDQKSEECVASSCNEIDYDSNVMSIDWYKIRYYKAKHQRQWIEIYQKPLTVITSFVRRFLPWAVLLIVWFFVVPSKKRRSHAGSAAMIWIGLILIMFCMPTVLRDRYLLPAFPAATMLAASVLLHLSRFIPNVSAKKIAVGLVLSAYCIIIVRGLTSIEHPDSKLVAAAGNNELTFTNQVRAIVGNEKIVFDYFMGDNNVQALLGYSQPNAPTQTQYAQAQWLIKPIEVNSHSLTLSVPTITSGFVSAVTNQTVKQKNHSTSKSQQVTLGLYPINSNSE